MKVSPRRSGSSTKSSSRTSPAWRTGPEARPRPQRRESSGKRHPCAGGAELRRLEVQPLHGVRGSHHTAPIGTVSQAEGMPQFVNRLFDGALQEKAGSGGQAIELLPQTMQGDKGARSL